MKTHLRIGLSGLLIFLMSCTNPADDTKKEDLESPYGTVPLDNQTIARLKKLLPQNWDNPPRAHSPAGNHERMLYAMTGQVRGIYQTVRFPNGQMVNTTRLATVFMDPSGRHLVGKDSSTKGQEKETTYFVIYYSNDENLFRGISWTHGLRGEEKPMQMVGKHVPGKLKILWKAYDPGRYAGNSSVLEIKSWNEFTWTITLYQKGEEHSKLTNTSILSQHWPEHR